MTEAERSGVHITHPRLPLAAGDLALLLGLAVLAVPTVLALGQQVWTTEAGAHGPLVLAVGAWLLVRGLATVKPLVKPGSLALTAAGLLVSLCVYVFGRAFDFISLEVAGLYGCTTDGIPRQPLNEESHTKAIYVARLDG